MRKNPLARIPPNSVQNVASAVAILISVATAGPQYQDRATTSDKFFFFIKMDV